MVGLLKWDDVAVEAQMKLEEVESGAQPEERVVPAGNQGLWGREGHSVSESRWPSGASSPQSFSEM